jgi:hypothetical protein
METPKDRMVQLVRLTQKLTPVKNIKLKLNLQDKLTTLFSLTPLFSFPGNFQKHEHRGIYTSRCGLLFKLYNSPSFIRPLPPKAILLYALIRPDFRLT